VAKGKRQNILQQRTAAQAANSRRRRKRRTGKKTIHYTLLILFVLAAGAILSLTTFFKIEAVSVAGTDHYSEEEMIAASGIQSGENLFRVSGAKVEETLKEQYPYIESVKISRKLPPTVEIKITQAIPSAAVFEGDKIVLITREGKVLERGKIFIPPAVPAVQGIPTTGVPEGQLLGEEAKEPLVMVNYLLDAMEGVGFQGITNVDVRDPLNMLIIYENRLLFKMGTEADLEHKLFFIQNVLKDLGPEEQGRIDVSNAKTKSWLILKDITLEEALALENKDKPGSGIQELLEDKAQEESSGIEESEDSKEEMAE